MNISACCQSNKSEETRESCPETHAKCCSDYCFRNMERLELHSHNTLKEMGKQFQTPLYHKKDSTEIARPWDYITLELHYQL